MAKFVFKMATLLRLRETTRDERRLELAEAYRVDEVLQRQLEGLGVELHELQTRCRQAVGPGTIDVDGLLESQRYELAIRSQQRELLRQREIVSAEIERRRQALVEADREVRALEKLRERQYERFRQEEDRLATKFLDEVGGQRAAREITR